jgi:uncharacterized protein
VTELQRGAKTGVFECRSLCGACCIEPSINQPFYGMPDGKPAGVKCFHLSEDMACEIFGDPRRPQVCAQFAAEPSICGVNREQARNNLQILEFASRPEAVSDETSNGRPV